MKRADTSLNTVYKRDDFNYLFYNSWYIASSFNNFIQPFIYFITRRLTPRLDKLETKSYIIRFLKRQLMRPHLLLALANKSGKVRSATYLFSNLYCRKRHLKTRVLEELYWNWFHNWFSAIYLIHVVSLMLFYDIFIK